MLTNTNSHPCTLAEVKVQPGDMVVCVMLDIDLVNCCLEVSLNPKLTSGDSAGSDSSGGRVLRSSSRKKKEVKSTEPMQPSGSLMVTVEFKSPHYFILSYSSLSGTGLAYGVMDSVSNNIHMV